MRRLFFFLGILSNLYCHAQNGMLIGYNNTHIGTNVAFEYLRTFNNFQLEIGLKYHIFNPHYDNQNMLLKDRVYPTSFLQHIGPIIGVNKKFPLNKTYFRPEAFFQSQFTYAGLHNAMYMPFGVLSNGSQIYQYKIVIFEEQYNLENILGIGFDFPITPKLRFYNRYGLIIGIFWGMDDQILLGRDGTYEYGLFYSLGLTYTFTKKNMD